MFSYIYIYKHILHHILSIAWYIQFGKIRLVICINKNKDAFMFFNKIVSL